MFQINSKLDHILQHLGQAKEVEEGSNSSDVVKANIEITKIHTIEDAKRFETELKAEDFEKTVYQHWSERMGTDIGAEKGLHKAYQLAEEMFTREFFTLCSWTGQSTSTESKFALNTLGGMTGFFWKVIHNCDKTFTKEATKLFLQSLMNKAKQRVEDPPKANRKTSAPKKRPKNLKYKVKDKKPRSTTNRKTLKKIRLYRQPITMIKVKVEVMMKRKRMIH